MKTLAMIPARKGSERLRYKNLALINGKPMIRHVIDSAKEAGIFDEIYVNSDSKIFSQIADDCNVNFYHRPPELGSSETKSDQVVYDFIQSHPCDTIVWVNPVSPLQPTSEIKKVVNHFLDSSSESLITVSEEQVHCVYDGKPVNFSEDGLFAKTQELKPVNPFVYSLMMWNSKAFAEQFEETGYAMFCGDTDHYPVSDVSALKVKTKSDLLLVDAIARGQSTQTEETKVEYDELVEELD